MYIPTRDASGVQKGLLCTVATHVMRAYSTHTAPTAATTAPDTADQGHARKKRKGQPREGQGAQGSDPNTQQAGPASESGGAVGQAELHMATSAAVCSLLALEHRALLPYLDNGLWPILWRTAFYGLRHGQESDWGRSPGGSGSGAGAQGGLGVSVAAAAAHHLVQAFADLRQLDKLVVSLLGAVGAMSGAGAGEAVLEQPQTQAALEPAHAAAAAVLLSHPRVLGALQEAVRQLPPGQVAPLLRSLTSTLRSLMAGWGGQEALQSHGSDSDEDDEDEDDEDEDGMEVDAVEAGGNLAQRPLPCVVLAVGQLVQACLAGEAGV